MQKKPISKEAACETCFAGTFCASLGVYGHAIQQVLHEATDCRVVSLHQILFHQKAPFHFFYVVKKGSFKKFSVLENGREQLYAFYLPGDLIGLDAVGFGYQLFSVAALEDDSVVCEIPAEKLLPFVQNNADMQQKLMTITSEQFHHHESIPRNAQAKEKVAAFLFNIATRYHHHSPINQETIHLPMSRQDIGNYLGLTIETISRIITELKAEGVLNSQGKNIVILDAKKLEKMRGF